MAHDERQIGELARSYTEAWCSHDPARVAAHYVPGGTIAINGGEAAGIAEVAESFIAAFPDIEVSMDDLVVRDDVVEYRWTFTGTSAETGKWVRIPGYEEWTIGADGRIASSRGNYDQAEYERQLQEGA
ncbi:MAG TPA: nuclear transport factor 2 family protein [Gaiellaceae bacterium]|jgi:predicted ester cyclase|nr:nuclear transport factor 2 family protein [Gaiellaceae bacterium]